MRFSGGHAFYVALPRYPPDTKQREFLLERCPVAKESQRGWKKYVPSLATIAKVFVAMCVIKLIITVTGLPTLMPPTARASYWLPIT